MGNHALLPNLQKKKKMMVTRGNALQTAQNQASVRENIQ